MYHVHVYNGEGPNGSGTAWDALEHTARPNLSFSELTTEVDLFLRTRGAHAGRGGGVPDAVHGLQVFAGARGVAAPLSAAQTL